MWQRLDTSFESLDNGQYNSRRKEVWHYQGQLRPTVCKKKVSFKKNFFYSSMALFFCHMKINSQNDFTSKTAKINHVRSNSKFQIKSIQHDFIFLSLIWFFLQTLILGLNFNVWQEINCQRKKIQIKNFTSDLKFPIKGSNSKFHITWNQIMTRKRGP